MEERAFLLAQLEAQQRGEGYAVVTILSAGGSTPRRSGKMLVYADGRTLGSIGGGAVERLATQDALSCLREQANACREYDLSAQNEALGMLCGGRMQVLIEAFCARPQLVLCGAGHVGGALIPVAQSAGFQVLLLDNRPAADIQDTIDLADRFLPVADFEAGLAALPAPEDAYYVIATYGHLKDAEALYAALQKPAAYIGMIGSRTKVAGVFARMRARGVSEEQLARVYAPIGLDIGGETPEAIALSIAAELLAVRYGRSGGHMRARG